MTKILKGISDIIFILLILALALYFILRVDNRIRIYNVLTGSMEDNIHAGDYILIIKKDDYQIGDVVTFGGNGFYVTHRIIEKDGNMITTKGDANSAKDEAIDKSNIVGKVILNGGILNFIINYKFGLVGFVLAIYLFTYYLDSRENEKEREKKELQKIEEEKKEKIVEEVVEEHPEEITDAEEVVTEEKVEEPVQEKPTKQKTAKPAKKKTESKKNNNGAKKENQKKPQTGAKKKTSSKTPNSKTKTSSKKKQNKK